MADNPFAPVTTGNARQAGLWDLRMMSAANRMETPFERGMGSSHGYGHTGSGSILGGMASMANEPDYSSFTYDPVLRQRAIDAGVRPLEANQVQPNVLFSNSGFMGNHPRLAHALESGIFAGAATRSGDTIGDNISNALEGMISGERMRKGLYNQQFARPFEAAGMMESLQDAQEQRSLRGAQIQRFKDESDIQRQRVAEQQMRDTQRVDATRPIPDSTGTWLYQGAQTAGPNVQNVGGSLANVPSGGWQHVPEGGRGKPAQNLSMGVRTQLMGMNIDPANASAEQITQAQRNYDNEQFRLAHGKAGSEAAGRDEAPGHLTPQQTQQVDTLKAQMNKLDSRETTSQLRQQVMLDKDWSGKGIAEQNKEIERRREAKRSELGDQISGIGSNKPKVRDYTTLK